MSHAEARGHEEALFAPTDPVIGRSALRLHLLVLSAEVVAVQTLGQVVPQLGVVLVSARRAHGGRGARAVRGHMRTGWTLVTDEGFPGDRVSVLKGGSGFHRRDTADDSREQDQHR